LKASQLVAACPECVYLSNQPDLKYTQTEKERQEERETEGERYICVYILKGFSLFVL